MGTPVHQSSNANRLESLLMTANIPLAHGFAVGQVAEHYVDRAVGDALHAFKAVFVVDGVEFDHFFGVFVALSKSFVFLRVKRLLVQTEGFAFWTDFKPFSL